MTSLATQLGRLAAPQTRVLEQTKRRVSLLFEPSLAASQDYDTVLKIGLSGLEGLINVETAFEQFRDDLFCWTSTQVQRAVLTKNENDNLDKIIDKFMLLATPYILLTATHQAFEWLIFRFEVHEYNVNTVIRTILPYYESNIFARIIALTNIKQNDVTWAWLYLHHKASVPATRQQVVNHCIASPSFMSFICDTVIAIHEDYNGELRGKVGIYYSMYASLACDVISRVNRVTDKIVSTFMTSIVIGLKSDTPSFWSAACVIVCQLCVHCQLSSVVAKSLCCLLIQKLTVSNVQLYMSTAAVLCQTQTLALEIKNSVAKRVVNRNELVSLVDEISTLNEQTDVDSLLLPLLIALMTLATEEEEYREKAVDLVMRLVKGNRLGDPLVLGLFKYVMSQLDGNVTSRELWSPMCQALAKSNVSAFDWALACDDLPSTTGKLLLQMVKNEVTSNGNITCAIDAFDLTSPDEKQRVIGLQRLIEIAVDETQLQHVIIEGLNDESPMVVNKAIQYVMNSGRKLNVAEHLINVLANDEMLNTKGKDRVQLLLMSVKALENVLVNEDMNKNIVSAVIECLVKYIKYDKLGEEILKLTTIKQSGLVQFLQPAIGKNATSREILEGVSKWVSQNFDERISYVKNESVKIYIMGQIYGDQPKNVQGIIIENILQVFTKIGDISMAMKELNSVAPKTTLQHVTMKFMRKGLSASKLVACLTAANAIISTINQETVFASEWMDISPLLELMIVTLKYLILIANDLEFGRTKLVQLIKTCISNPSMTVKLLYICVQNGMVYECGLLLKVLQVQVGHSPILCVRNLVIEKSKDVVKLLLVCTLNAETFVKPVVEILGALKDRIVNEASEFKDTQPMNLVHVLLRNKEEIMADFSHLQKTLTKDSKSKKKQNASEYLLAMALDPANPVRVRTQFMKLVPLNLETTKMSDLTKEVMNVLKRTDSETLTFVSEQQIECTVEMINRILSKPNLAVTLKALTSKCLPILEVALNHVEMTLYNCIDDSEKVELINAVLNVVCDSKSTQMAHLAKNKLMSLSMDFELWSKFIGTGMPKSPAKDTAAKKRKISTVESFELGSERWIVLVEYALLTQDLKIKQVIPLMFDTLQSVHNDKSVKNKDTVIHLALSILSQTCTDQVLEKVSSSEFHVDCLVKTLPLCTTQTTVHLALTLIIAAVKHFRSCVVMHIVGVFTFMGCNVLAKDDAFSLQVVNNTIASVIPALVKSGDSSDLMELLRMMCGCAFDVADHRRIPLLCALVTSTGNDGLWLVLVLLLERLVLHWKSDKVHKDTHLFMLADTKNIRSVKEEILCMDILCEFDGIQQLEAITKLFQYGLQYDKPSSKLPNIVNPDAFTDNQKRHFLYSLYTLTYSLISSEQLVSKLADMDNCVVSVAESLSECLLESSTEWIAKIKSNPTNKLWSVMLGKSNAILNKLHMLLPAEVNVKVIQGLLVQGGDNRVSALNMFNSLLVLKPTPFTQQHVPLLCSVFNVIGGWLDKESGVPVPVLQHATYTIKLLARVIAPHDFVSLEKTVASCVGRLDSWRNDDAFIVGGMVTLVAEAVAILKAKMLPLIHRCINVTVDILSSNTIKQTNPLACIACVSVMVRCVEQMRQLVVPQLPIMLAQICLTAQDKQLTEKLEKLDANYKNVLASKVSQLMKHASTLDTRILLPAVAQAYSTICSNSPLDVHYIFTLLGEHAKKQSAKAVAQEFALWNTTLKSLIDFRSRYSKLNVDEIDVVESELLNSICEFMLKLSEKNVKQLIFTYVGWADQSMQAPLKSTVRLNVITFFKLMQRLSSQLKSLFTIFAGRVFSLACQVIKSEHASNEDSDRIFVDSMYSNLLLETTVNTVHNCIAFDKSNFVNEERRNMLVGPLVAQLANVHMQGYEQRVTGSIAKCLAGLMCRCTDETQMKKMNYEMLLHTRHEKTVVTKHALITAHTVYTKLGDRCSTLIPETVPFLAQLMQDENEEVQNVCHSVIKVIESNIGNESLAEYF